MTDVARGGPALSSGSTHGSEFEPDKIDPGQELRHSFPTNEAEVAAAIAERRNPRLIAKAIVKGGRERVAEARRLIAERPSVAEDRLRDLELLGHLAVLTGDRVGAAAIVEGLFAEGAKGRVAALKPLATAMMGNDIGFAEELVALAQRLAPNARETAEIAARLKARQGDQEAALDALTAAQDEFPKSTEVAIRKARNLGRLHRWEEARIELEGFIARVQHAGRAKEMAKLASVYAYASDPEGLPARPLRNIDVRYLNLDSDLERRERVERLFNACGIELIRTPGVRGSLLPQVVREKVAPSISRLTSPTLGVFLSHVRTWELVAEGDRPALVLEDDAQPVFRLASELERLAPQVKDITFVNYRLSRWVRKLGPQPDRFQQVPIERMSEVLAGDAAPPGGDGYVLTPAGARKLLDYIAHDGCIGHVDVQMLSYALRPSDYAEEEDGGRQVTRLAGYWRRHKGERRLDAHVLYPALTEAIDFGESARRAGEAETTG